MQYCINQRISQRISQRLKGFRDKFNYLFKKSVLTLNIMLDKDSIHTSLDSY